MIDTINFLVREDAFRLGIPSTSVVLSANEKAPDDGIDARIDSPAASEWIPPGPSIWQFKAFDATPSQIKKELTAANREALRGQLRSGAHYVLVVGRDPGTKRKSRETAISDGLKSIGATGTGRLLTSVEVASWASRYPAILLRAQFHRSGAELLRHDEWAAVRSHLGRFVPTTEQSRVVEGLMEELRGVHHGSRMPRLTGLSGLGKTRAVLEATRPEDIAGRIIYASNPQQVNPSLLAWLRRTPGVVAVLVVDNCAVVQRQEIEQQLAAAGTGIYCITIGPEGSTPRAEEGFYNLGRMSPEELQEIIKAVFPGLQLETQGYVSRLSSGFVKAALMLGQYYQGGATLPPAVAAEHEDMRQFLDGLVGDDPSGELRTSLSALSLFTELGVEDGLEGELKIAADFVGIELGKARRAIERARKQEIVETEGRRRRVTPEILALLLAAELWGAQATDLVVFYDRLPDIELRKRFLRRLGSLGQDDRTARVVVQLLESHEVFASLSDLNARERGDLLLYLASAHPEAGLQALERLIGAAGVEELRRLNGGRRSVVATLERLVWLPTTFEGAAKLLLALAEAENERYSNNATGVWNQLFRPLLSGSAVPALERLRFLERTLYSDAHSPARRRLALDALMHAFETEVSRMVVMDNLGGRPLPIEWRPQTQGDLRGALRFAYDLLERATRDPDAEFRLAAKDALLNNVRMLFTQGLGEEVIVRLRSMIGIEPPTTLATMAKALGSLLAYDRDRMPASLLTEVQDMREQLLASSFDVRLRSTLGRPGPGDYKDDLERPTRQQEEAIVLADEAWDDRQLLESNWEWLLSSDAQRSWPFFARLGELDEDSRLLNRAEERVGSETASADRPVFQWAAMLEGARQAGRGDDVWNRLTTLAHSRATGDVVLEALWRSEATDAAAGLIAEMIASGAVSIDKVGMLVYGNWIGKISVPSGRLLVDALHATNSPLADEAALHLLGMRLGFNKEQHSAFEDQVWRILEGTVTGTKDTMSAHHWMVLAKPLVAVNPGRVGVLLVRLFGGGEYISGNDARLGLFRESARRDPTTVWPATAETLLAAGEGSRHLSFTLKGHLVEVFPEDLIFSWVRGNGEEAAVAVMALTSVGPTLSSLQRRLLIEFTGSKDLQSALLSNMYTGAFSGSHHGWLEQRLEWVRSWARDPVQSIRRWATSLISGLEKEIRRTKLREEEEDY